MTVFVLMRCVGIWYADSALGLFIPNGHYRDWADEIVKAKTCPIIYGSIYYLSIRMPCLSKQICRLQNTLKLRLKFYHFCLRKILFCNRLMQLTTDFAKSQNHELLLLGIIQEEQWWSWHLYTFSWIYLIDRIALKSKSMGLGEAIAF